MKLDERYTLIKQSEGIYLLVTEETKSRPEAAIKLNMTGALIWLLLKQGSTPVEILEKVVELYGIDEAHAKTDINNFMNYLYEQKILIL